MGARRRWPTAKTVEQYNTPTIDVCARRWCTTCSCHHDGRCIPGARDRWGWCYQHDTYHGPSSIHDTPTCSEKFYPDTE